MNTEILAGLTVLTVINLKHSDDGDLHYTATGPGPEGKFMGFVLETTMGRPIINSSASFDTAEEARAHMHAVVKACREWINPGSAAPHPNSLVYQEKEQPA